MVWNGIPASGGENPFEVFGRILDAQVASTAILLKAFGKGDVAPAISGLENTVGRMATGGLVLAEAYQIHLDVNAGLDPSAATVGAVVNGVAIYGSGAAAAALSKSSCRRFGWHCGQ